jgi:hypothetical protein
MREPASLLDADAKGFTFVPCTSSREEVVAMATMLGEHPHVKELVLIANEGDVLYSSKCPDSPPALPLATNSSTQRKPFRPYCRLRISP